MYEAEKSHVTIYLTRSFYLCYLMIELWGQNFVRPETCYNLIRI